jgi:ABC-type thiamine transport system substrate-binding protein
MRLILLTYVTSVVYCLYQENETNIKMLERKRDSHFTALEISLTIFAKAEALHTCNMQSSCNY